MTPITLDIFFMSEDVSQLEELGVKRKISDCETREVTFLQINAISPYHEDGLKLSCIHANGSEYICTQPYNKLKSLIR